ILATMEVVVDYAEEDIEESPADILEKQLAGAVAACDHLLGTCREGRILRDGARVVIAGKPNVGKSTLLNRLLGEQRAIVSPIPGTTRDFLTEAIELNGIPVLLVDTAGLRFTTDEVESEGANRTRKWVDEADLVLFVVDVSERLEEEDRRAYNRVCHKPHLLVMNKADLKPKAETETFGTERPVTVSAVTGAGLEDLKHRTLSELKLDRRYEEGIVVTAERHRNALERTRRHLADSVHSLKSGYARDLVATDVRAALDALFEITGENATEAILETVFSNFCVGK
ncbi:MAG: tRNA modification GTPase, partial [Terriglobia bacterium]